MKKISKSQLADRVVNEDFGKLKSELHHAAYSFERGCATLVSLLDDDRWKSCSAGFDDPQFFLDAVRLPKDLKVAAETRRMLAVHFKRLFPVVSNRQIAKTLGVRRRTIDHDVGGQNGPGGGKKLTKSKTERPLLGKMAHLRCPAPPQQSSVQRRDDRKDRDLKPPMNVRLSPEKGGWSAGMAIFAPCLPI